MVPGPTNDVLISGVGTNVTITGDGNVVGRTPYTSEVTVGKQEIEFRKEGYYPATQSTTVEPNKHVMIELPMLAR